MSVSSTVEELAEAFLELCAKKPCIELLQGYLQNPHTISRHNATATAAGVINSGDEMLLLRVDNVWQMRSAFTVLTMQSGFALIEVGSVSVKNITGVVARKIIDITFASLSYWLVGYALNFGDPATPYFGFGHFGLNHVHNQNMGTVYTEYFYYVSFVATSTTIVSGAVSERMTLLSHITYSFFKSIFYCVSASWCWNSKGFLNQAGFYDFAGGFVVFGSGGAAAAVASAMVGPRKNRFKDPHSCPMSSEVTALSGLLMVWSSWFAFNSGSSQGVEGTSGDLWKLNALVTVNTLNASVGGCIAGVGLSMILKKRKVDVPFLIFGLLGGLVSITASCSVVTPLEALIIGAVGSILAVCASELIPLLELDDPVGSVSVHFSAAIWGCLAVGLFGERTVLPNTPYREGLLHGGGLHQLGLQLIGMICVGTWSALTTFATLVILNRAVGLRMDDIDEDLGADIVDHGVMKPGEMKRRLESVLDVAGKQMAFGRWLKDIGKEAITEEVNADIDQRLLASSVGITAMNNHEPTAFIQMGSKRSRKRKISSRHGFNFI